MSYTLGALVRLSAAFTDQAGLPDDPTTVLFKTKSPAGLVSNYAWPTDVLVVRDAAGLFHVDITADEVGNWCYRSEGAGDVQAASEGDFDVDESCFT